MFDEAGFFDLGGKAADHEQEELVEALLGVGGLLRHLLHQAELRDHHQLDVPIVHQLDGEAVGAGGEDFFGVAALGEEQFLGLHGAHHPEDVRVLEERVLLRVLLVLPSHNLIESLPCFEIRKEVVFLGRKKILIFDIDVTLWHGALSNTNSIFRSFFLNSILI